MGFSNIITMTDKYIQPAETFIFDIWAVYKLVATNSCCHELHVNLDFGLNRFHSSLFEVTITALRLVAQKNPEYLMTVFIGNAHSRNVSIVSTT